MNLTWQLALVILGVLGFLAVIIWLEYRRPQDKEAKKYRDPIFVTVVVSVLIIFIILVMEGMDVLPEGWSKDHWWAFIILIVGIWYWNYQSVIKLKPMPMPKLERAAWDLIYKRAKARPHRGIGFGSPLPFHNITESKEKGTYNKVVNFLCRTKRFGGMFVLVGLDIGNAYPLRYVENPDLQFVKRLFGREVAQQYDIERELLKKALEPEEEHEYAEEEAQAQATAY